MAAAGAGHRPADPGPARRTCARDSQPLPVKIQDHDKLPKLDHRLPLPTSEGIIERRAARLPGARPGKAGITSGEFSNGESGEDHSGNDNSAANGLDRAEAGGPVARTGVGVARDRRSRPGEWSRRAQRGVRDRSPACRDPPHRSAATGHRARPQPALQPEMRCGSRLLTLTGHERWRGRTPGTSDGAGAHRYRAGLARCKFPAKNSENRGPAAAQRG